MSPSDADAEDLAGQQLARADRAQQQLDDARRLLLDDAGGHPDPVAEELAVEDHDRGEGHALLRTGVVAALALDGQRRRRPARARRRRARLDGADDPSSASSATSSPRAPDSTRDVDVALADEPARLGVARPRGGPSARRRTLLAAARLGGGARARRVDGGRPSPSVGPPVPSSCGSTSTPASTATVIPVETHKRALAHALDDLAAGDEPDRRRRSRSRHDLAEQLGQRRLLGAEAAHPARAAGGVEQRLLVGLARRARRPRRRRGARRRSRREPPRATLVAGTSTSTRQRRPAPPRAQLGDAPATRRRARRGRSPPRRTGARRARAGGWRRRPARRPARARAAPR